MDFKLFSDVKYNEIPKELKKIDDIKFNIADVYIDVDNRKLVLHTDDGIIDISFSNHDEMLDAIIKIGKASLSDYVKDVLDERKLRVTYSNLYISEDDVNNTLNDVRSIIKKLRERILNGNFRLKIYLGYIMINNIDNLADKYSELANSIDSVVEKYEETHCEFEECDDSRIYAYFYAIPEERCIVVNVDLRTGENVGKLEKKYDSSNEFLKALDEYMHVIAIGTF